MEQKKAGSKPPVFLLFHSVNPPLADVSKVANTPEYPVYKPVRSAAGHNLQPFTDLPTMLFFTHPLPSFLLLQVAALAVVFSSAFAGPVPSQFLSYDVFQTLPTIPAPWVYREPAPHNHIIHLRIGLELQTSRHSTRESLISALPTTPATVCT